jgi:hypothetical protein
VFAKACQPIRTICVLAIGFLWFTISAVLADELLYRYEGDMLPYDDSAGWLDGLCEEPCSESLEDGHLVLRWPYANDLVNYHYWIALSPEQAPPTLWVEWRFRSNHPLGPYFYGCDAWFTLDYDSIHELVNMYGDAAISVSGDDVLLGLDIDQFHTYRFESPDGQSYSVSADGFVFIVGEDDHVPGAAYLQFGGNGGCIGDQIPNMVNEWDFVRFGTISYGEQIVASDPPSGFLSARQQTGLDRFAVTFDEPNYVYLPEIAVEVSDGDTPVVTQTRRRENDEPDTVEIVLDRPLAFGETTRFTFDDGVAVNVIEYTFAPGDTDGDGDADLHDFALFQACFGQSPVIGPCAALDLDPDDAIDLADYSAFQDLLTGR